MSIEALPVVIPTPLNVIDGSNFFSRVVDSNTGKFRAILIGDLKPVAKTLISSKRAPQLGGASRFCCYGALRK